MKINDARKAFRDDYVRRSHKTGSNLPSFEMSPTGQGYTNSWLESEFQFFLRGYLAYEAAKPQPADIRPPRADGVDWADIDKPSPVTGMTPRERDEALKPQPAAPEVVGEDANKYHKGLLAMADKIQRALTLQYAREYAYELKVELGAWTPPPAPQGDVAEAVAKEREAILDEMDRMWRQFVAQCESLEDETLPPMSDDPLKLAAHHFMRGQHSAAKRIRRSVDHPKYNSDCPVAQAAIRARAEQKVDRA